MDVIFLHHIISFRLVWICCNYYMISFNFYVHLPNADYSIIKINLLEGLMSGKFIEHKIAQIIVSRVMNILDINVNVMDERGIIIASGDAERIGTLHEGALLVLSQHRVVDVDESMVVHLHGVYRGVNFPLRLGVNVVGVIGLSGEPQLLRQYGELVCTAAEMMIEQTQLMKLLAEERCIREELALQLITENGHSALSKIWAQHQRINLRVPRVVSIVTMDNGCLDADTAMSELHYLQKKLSINDSNSLVAITSPSEIAILKTALNKRGEWDVEIHRNWMNHLQKWIKENLKFCYRISIGGYFTGDDGIYRSYLTAQSVMHAGKQRMPEKRCYFYHELILPVLLEGFRSSWQQRELARVLSRLTQLDCKGLLRRTLFQWFKNDLQPQKTSNALFIHRNTLDYRLKKISDITGLDLGSFENRCLLYIALQLEKNVESQ